MSFVRATPSAPQQCGVHADGDRRKGHVGSPSTNQRLARELLLFARGHSGGSSIPDARSVSHPADRATHSQLAICFHRIVVRAAARFIYPRWARRRISLTSK